MNNVDFFKLSLDNSKLKFDFSDPKGTIVIPLTKYDENELVKADKKLFELITTYKNIYTDKEIPKDQKDKLVNDILELIVSTKNINYSSFCVYFQVLGFSWSMFVDARSKGLLSEKECIRVLKKALNLYIKNRHDIYMSHGYSPISLQVKSDSSSSRRKGRVGFKSLENIMIEYGFSFVSTYGEFMHSNSYFSPENNKKLLLEILKKENIKFNFKKKRDGKNPDLMFKINNQIYILEHKLASGAGGSQNMELNELISFIDQEEDNNNIHYIACLEGNDLHKMKASKQDPKTITQYNNIMEALDNNPSNYFVNEYGLRGLLGSYLNKE